MLSITRLSAAAALLTSATLAQAPDIIHYTFDSGDATNSATGMVPDGVPNTGVTFGPSVCGGGCISVESTSPPSPRVAISTPPRSASVTASSVRQTVTAPPPRSGRSALTNR